LHHRIKTSIEVKGHIQGTYYCGKIAKLPNYGGMTLDEMNALRNTSHITIPAIKRFAQWVDSKTRIPGEAVRAFYGDLRKRKGEPPPFPVGGVGGLADSLSDPAHDGSVELKPRTPASRSKAGMLGLSSGSGLVTGDSFETGLHVYLELARKLGRVPTTEEALGHLRVNGLHTGTWEENEAKRAEGIRYNLDYISKTFDPAKLARSLPLDLAAIDLTEHVGWVERHYPDGICPAMAEDVSVFLAITKFCLVVDPNENGSLPFQRFQSIWQKLYASGLLKRQFRWDRRQQIRDRLKPEGVVEVFGRPERRNAQKWRIGHNFPDYDRLSSLFEGSPSITTPLSASKEDGREERGNDLTLCLQDDIIRFHQQAEDAGELVRCVTPACWSLEGGEEVT